jgi:hypothetical protein
VFKKCQVLAGSPADLIVEERRNVFAAASLITVEPEHRTEPELDGGLANSWFRPQRLDGCIELVVPDGGEEVAEIMESDCIPGFRARLEVGPPLREPASVSLDRVGRKAALATELEVPLHGLNNQVRL